MKVEPIRDSTTVREIINYLKMKKSYRNLVLFATGIYTGLRVSDILKLKVKDVKEMKFLYLKEQKTKTNKSIKLHKELIKIYKAYCEGKDGEEFLIKSQKGNNRAIGRKQAYTILKNIGKEFNLEHLGSHTMRKTYGYTVYKSSGNNIALTQSALSHKSAEYTLRYIGVTQEEINNITSNLNYQ